MKKVQTIRLLALLFLCAYILQGCFKDTVSKTYTLYIPVYKTNEEVRANIKSSTPTDIKNPGKMFVFGNYIFLNEVDKGIHIIDNTNPSSPVNKYFINIPGNQEVAVTGNILYADLYTDLVTIDISNPAAIQVKKITENVFPNRRYVNGFVADTTRIITEWITKDTTVTSEINSNLNNRGILYYDALFSGAPLSNAASAPTKGVGGSMARFTLLNNYLYTVTENALNVFNISQPENPAFSNKVNLGWGVETIYPFKNNLFLGSQTGMVIFSAANPLQPVQLGTFTHARVCDPVIADDNYAYVTLRTGSTCGGMANELDVVNIQNLPATTLVKSYPLTNPHGLSKEGNTLFVCDGTAGLKVYDATNINSLQLLTTVGGINTYDVIAYNGVAIVVTKDGLYQYDYTNRSNLKLLSKISMN
jgi:hypothetical protein